MKKLLLLLIFCSSFSLAQFTVSESSIDWKTLGKEQNNTVILIKDDKAKLRLADFRNKSIGFDPLAAFKSRDQQNSDNLRGEIRKGNEGVKSGYYEFLFNIEPDTLEKLYEVIKNHFDSKTKEIVTLTFPEGNLYLDFNSKTAFYAVSFGIEVDGTKIFGAPLLKSQVNKIFGKKN